MFELKEYLAVLVKATALVFVAVLCAAFLYHVVRLATSRQARADLVYTVGLAPSANLPTSQDDLALFNSVTNESVPIVAWVQFCAGIENPYGLPTQYHYLFAQPGNPRQEIPYGRLPHRIERALLELNIALNNTRYAAAKRAQAAYEFWQVGSLIVIALGAASTIMIGLSSTQFGRETGTTQQVMRTLAIIFPAFGTAATAAIAFYGPQTEWSQATATQAGLSQLHAQIAYGVQAMECNPKEPASGQNDALAGKLGEWTQKYLEVMATTNTARQSGGATPDGTQKGGMPTRQ